MSENLYRKNFMQRGWQGLLTFMRSLPESKANAVYIAVAFFVVLIAFMEYKVFESTYTATGDIVLAASVLSVTAVGGIVAELILKRNSKASDDQLIASDALFYLSLIASAIAGFGVWAQTSGTNEVHLLDYTISLPRFADFVFVMITAVTVADVFLLRWYISEDVDAKHRRNVERVESRKRASELNTQESLIAFEAEVERKAKKTLMIEARRKSLKDELTRMYGGQVPPEVLRKAMADLDAIKATDDAADDDRDGVNNANDTTYNPPARQQVVMQPARQFGAEVDPTNRPDSQK